MGRGKGGSCSARGCPLGWAQRTADASCAEGVRKGTDILDGFYGSSQPGALGPGPWARGSRGPGALGPGPWARGPRLWAQISCNAVRSHLRLQPLLALRIHQISSAFQPSCNFQTMPYVTLYMCDECCDRKATINKQSYKFNRYVGLCAECDSYMWVRAKKESEKYSEFTGASYEARIFERDGSCLIFDSMIDILARKCELRDTQLQSPHMPAESSQSPALPMDESSD